MGGGQGGGQRGGLGRRASVSGRRSPAAPLSDRFSKAPHLRPLWGPECLSQAGKGEKGRGLNLLLAPAALGESEVLLREGRPALSMSLTGAGVGPGRKPPPSRVWRGPKAPPFLLPWISPPPPVGSPSLQPASVLSVSWPRPLVPPPATVLDPEAPRGRRWRWWWQQ